MANMLSSSVSFLISPIFYPRFLYNRAWPSYHAIQSTAISNNTAGVFLLGICWA